MLDLSTGPEGNLIFSGRFDATQVDRVREFMAEYPEARVLDFGGLEYISSAGLGILLSAQKQAMQSGGGLRLVNVNSHIGDIFRFSGFDQIFDIEAGPG